MQKQKQKLLFLLVIFLMLPNFASAYGAPDYLPDGAHPRIWLTPDVISQMKTKKAANTTEYQAFINRCDNYFVFYDNNAVKRINVSNPYKASALGIYSWPDGDGYVGSGIQEAIASWGIAYQTLKGSNYGTAGATADDVKAATYATHAFDLMSRMIILYSAGEEQDGIEFIRLSDDKSNQLVTINADEALVVHANGLPYTTNGNMSFKSGYAARALAQTIPLFYDWFYTDPLMTSQLKTTLYKMMYRHIDWYNATRSTYNNGILIGGTYYHEDSFGKDANGNTIAGACSAPNNCNLSSVAATYSYKQYGYANPNGIGRIGSNFYEPFAGLAMLNAVAAYGDAPQADADHYLNYAKSLWQRHFDALSSTTGYKGGDSLEGLAYFSDWQELFQGILGLNTATGLDTWSGFDFPKEVAKNYIHNTDPTLTVQLQRGAVNKPQNVAFWLHPSEYAMNTFAHILRNYYPASDEAKQLQYFLNNASLTPRLDMDWQRFVFRDNAAPVKDFSSEPLAYHSIGSGVVTTRSSWSKTATDSVTAQLVLGGIFNVDHQAQDQGALIINRGVDRLLSRYMDSSSNSDETSKGQNSIVFGDGISDGNGLITVQSNDSGMTSGFSSSRALAAPVIDRFENNSNYAYVSGDVHNIFDGTGNTNLAKNFRRTFLHLRPNLFVVYDEARSNSAKSNKKSWYMQFEAAPVIDVPNRNISAIVGNSKIFLKGLYPATGTYVDTPMTNNVNMSSVFHRVKYEPAVTQEYDQFLHVIEATGSTDSQTTSTLITGTGGRGALIESPTENIIAMFTDNQNADDITNLIYSATTITQSKNIITSLTPNQNYNVQIDGGVINTYLASMAGIIEFTNASSGFHNYAVSLSLGDVIAPTAPTGLSVM
jgi:hypothetical protein